MKPHQLIALTAVSVAVGLTMPPSAGAGDIATRTPGFEAQLDARLTPAEVKASLQDFAVDAYAKRFGVSLAIAEKRLILQGLAPNLKTFLRQKLGDADGFSGIEFDNDKGQWVIIVVGDDASEQAARLMHQMGYVDGNYRIERSTHTYRDREQASDQLAALGRRAQLDGTIEDTVRGLRFTVEKTAAAKLGSALERDVAEVSARTNGTPISLVLSEKIEPARGQVTCWLWPAVPPAIPARLCDAYVGGVRFETSGGVCSTGFYANWGPGTHYIITAGHCTVAAPYQSPVWSINPVNAVTSQSGIVGQTHPGGYTPWSSPSGDYGALAMLAWTMYPGYYNWGSGGLSTLHWIALSTPPTGTWVCRNGNTTDTSCGTISTQDRRNAAYTVYGTTFYVDHMFEVSGACSAGGDSGGPWTMAASETAVGIHSYSSGSCSITGGTPISHPINDWGLTPYTA